MKLTRPMRRGESGGRLVTTVVAAAAVVSVLSAAELQSRRIQLVRSHAHFRPASG